MRGVLPKHRTGQYGGSHDLPRVVTCAQVKETSDLLDLSEENSAHALP